MPKFHVGLKNLLIQANYKLMLESISLIFQILHLQPNARNRSKLCKYVMIMFLPICPKCCSQGGEENDR